MTSALVLNATYEPLSVVSGRRAVVLVLSDKADQLHPSADAFRSASLEVPVPSVVRLRNFVRVPYRRCAPLSRRAVFARDGHSCQYCGKRAESIDHVRPRSRGGEHAWENVVAACRRCNTVKRDRLLSETTMRLRAAPRAPSPDVWLVLGRADVPDEWLTYLGSTSARSA